MISLNKSKKSYVPVQIFFFFLMKASLITNMTGQVITSCYFQVHRFPRAGLQGPSQEEQKLADTCGPRAEEEPEVEQGQGEGEEGAE